MKWRPVKVLDVVMVLAEISLALGTIVAVASLPSTLRDGGVGVEAVVRREATDRIVREKLDVGRHRVVQVDAVATIDVPKHDTAARVVLGVTPLVMLGLGWAGLIATRRVVASALAGSPFATENTKRLRVLGAALAAVPVVAAAANTLIDATLDAGAAGLRVYDTNTEFWLVAAVAAFALAEVFREGASLRELDEATI